jgi:hypothetical protein
VQLQALSHLEGVQVAMSEVAALQQKLLDAAPTDTSADEEVHAALAREQGAPHRRLARFRSFVDQTASLWTDSDQSAARTADELARLAGELSNGAAPQYFAKGRLALRADRPAFHFTLQLREHVVEQAAAERTERVRSLWACRR